MAEDQDMLVWAMRANSFVNVFPFSPSSLYDSLGYLLMPICMP